MALTHCRFAPQEEQSPPHVTNDPMPVYSVASKISVVPVCTEAASEVSVVGKSKSRLVARSLPSASSVLVFVTATVYDVPAPLKGCGYWYGA
jgi:hypothetical protein